jgi:hypothetical protein
MFPLHLNHQNQTKWNQLLQQSFYLSQQLHLLKIPFREKSWQKGKFIAANIYIDGTYDGATTNENGQFSFSTTATGNQVLIAFVYETSKTTINVADFKIKQSFY